jgi:DNA mismatch endonuclease (patch repair protein)
MLRRPPSASSTAARKVMLGNRRRDSRCEIAIRRELHKSGRRYRVDFPIRVPDGRPIRPDIVFTRAHVAVFVDGCFWHGCPEHGTQPRANSSYWRAKIEVNQQRDRMQTDALEQHGWTVIRVWEHEGPAAAAKRVAAALLAASRRTDDASSG